VKYILTVSSLFVKFCCERIEIIIIIITKARRIKKTTTKNSADYIIHINTPISSQTPK
jgi:hypothetical protein